MATTTDERAHRHLPATPAGRAAQWWLNLLGSGRASLSWEEAAEGIDPKVLGMAGAAEGEEVQVAQLAKAMWVPEQLMTAVMSSEVDDYSPWGIHMIVTHPDGSR